MADLDVVHELLVVGADAVVGADDGVALDDQVVAGGDRHAAGAALVGDLADADLRAAQVAQDRDVLSGPFRRFANLGQHGRVAFDGAVRKVEPAHVHARVQQTHQRVHPRARRAHRCQDLRINHRVIHKPLASARPILMR